VAKEKEMKKDSTIYKCKECGVKYDINETIRVYGDMHWVGRFCSALCVTKATCQEAKDDTKRLSDHLINIIELFDKIKFVEIETREICGQNMAIVSLPEYDELFKYIEKDVKGNRGWD
jgi:hypothetical protein